jgi:hypothetical protein
MPSQCVDRSSTLRAWPWMDLPRHPRAASGVPARVDGVSSRFPLVQQNRTHVTVCRMVPMRRKTVAQLLEPSQGKRDLWPMASCALPRSRTFRPEET